MTAKKRPPPPPPVLKVKTRPLPPLIPDTPENVAQSIMHTPPKKREEWDYLKQKPERQ